MSNGDPVPEKHENLTPTAGVSAAPVENETTVSQAKIPKRKSTEVKDLEQLLQVVYDAPRPRTRLKKSEMLAIEAAPGTGEVRSEFLEIAKNDLTLDRTRQLMLIGASFDAVGPRARITRFVRDVLREHPAYQAPTVANFFAEDSQRGSQDVALHTLVSQKYTLLPWPADQAPLKKAQLEKCRSNAVQCFLLILWSASEKPLIEIVEQLRSYVWRGIGIRKSSALKLAAALLQSRDTVAIAIVYELMKQELAKALEELESVRLDERNAVLRAQKLERSLSEAESLLNDHSSEIAHLKQNLRLLEEDFANYKALSIDEHETLRGRVLGRLRAELTLLDAGLHALKREPPKVHVMIDHAERAIDGIKSEILKLEEK